MKRYLRNSSIQERLFHRRKIDEKTGCWLYLGGKNHSGHGVMWNHEKKLETVHRISYREFVGKIKNQILHKTNCPNKHCFNPEHLYDGNHQDNMNDLRKLNGFYKDNRGLGAKTREK